MSARIDYLGNSTLWAQRNRLCMPLPLPEAAVVAIVGNVGSPAESPLRISPDAGYAQPASGKRLMRLCPDNARRNERRLLRCW